ncbi:MAG: hypothetical protein Q8R28_02195 [Dehalococcoidia bacterium]|nr:hypothetical protein [Dehalococcoidia bacterium]MDP2659527.1 hypothetical protein [Dehalococcoidia bacterium]
MRVHFVAMRSFRRCWDKYEDWRLGDGQFLPRVGDYIDFGPMSLKVALVVWNNTILTMPPKGFAVEVWFDRTAQRLKTAEYIAVMDEAGFKLMEEKE